MESTDNLHVKSTGDLSSGTQQRSSASRMLIFLVILFALATVVMAIVLAVTVVRAVDKINDGSPATNEGSSGQKGSTPPPTTTVKPSAGVCLTRGCVVAAAQIATAIDETINPCDNFYEFACNSWKRSHVIPEDKGSFGVFSKLDDDVKAIMKNLLERDGDQDEPEVVEKLKRLYKECQNTDVLEEIGLTYIQQFLESLGGWPVLFNAPGGHWDEATFDLEDLLIKTRPWTESLPLIHFVVGQDDKNPSKYILSMDQPTLGMPSRDYYLKARNDTVLMAYQTLWKNVFAGFGVGESVAAAAAAQVVDMEIEIANITVPKEQRVDPEKLYNLMTVGDLRNNFTMFDWHRFINGVMENVVNISISAEEPIVVQAPEYFAKMSEVLAGYSNRTIADYIIGRQVIDQIFYLPEKFRDFNLQYQTVLTGTANQLPRWEDCGYKLENVMPQVLGRVFVQERFHQDARQDVLDMVQMLIRAFKGMLDDVQWMDEATKEIAREKADYIEPRIGYPDEVYNLTVLTERYENVTVYEGNPLKTVMGFNRDSVYRTLILLRKDYDRSKWDMSAATVNAYYSPLTNQITFPAAILQPPFYSKSQPSYLNYGGIGYVIGHEITHGFDDYGRKYDKYGNLRQWWSEEAVAKFKVQTQCTIDQYDNFTVSGTGGMHLNGIFTLGENIADNGGIKESFQAYRKWVEERGQEEDRLPGLSYTPNQLFFMNSALVWCEKTRDKEKIRRIRIDPHSSGEYRVIGSMQNSEEFSQAFNCPKTSYMNPQKKCEVW